MIRYINVFLFLFFCSFNYGQSVFSLEDSLIILEKTTDFENVHWYGEIVNIPDTSEISMQWKLRTPNGIPANWQTNFDPGTNDLLYVTEGDSARFTLFKDLTFLQKLIIGVKHNGDIGTGRFEFDLYPMNNPSDMKTQVYEITFKELTAVKETAYPQDLIYLGDEGFIVKEKLGDFRIYSLDGRVLYSAKEEFPGLLDMGNQSGIMVVSFEYEGVRYSRKFIDIGR